MVPAQVVKMLSPELFKEASKKGDAWQVITYHYNRARVEKVDGRAITLDRPLRGDLTMALKAKVLVRAQPIERCAWRTSPSPSRLRRKASTPSR